MPTYRLDVVQYQYLYERPSAPAFGVGQCQVAGVEYISNGSTWTLAGTGGGGSGAGTYSLITDYGVVGAADDTATFSAAAASGKTVYIPAGTYIVNGVTGWASNTRFIGDGWNTIIKQKNGAAPNTHAFNMQHEGNSNLANNIKNIILEDFWLRGYDDNPTFEEHTHLISTSAITGLTLNRLKVSSFKGDGVYIGSNVHATEMHNVNLKIYDCEFDGGNNENRNAISVIDCDGVVISRSKFKNVTRANMPGAIDFEPNSVFNFINNVEVSDCEFNNIGGNAGCVGLYYKDIAYVRLPSGVKYLRNTFRNCHIALRFEYRGTIHDDGTDPEFDLEIESNNVSLCTNPFVVLGTRLVSITKNDFFDNTNGGELGYLGNYRQLDSEIISNRFIRCGTTGGKGLSLFEVWRCKVAFNLFDDCGTGSAGSSVGLDFGTDGESKWVDLLYNEFRSTTGVMLTAIQKESTHTLHQTTNRFIGNSIQGAMGNAFQADNSDSLEHSWTPTLEGASSTGAVTYTTRYGTYTKIGRIVNFKAVIVCTANACTGQVRITLPETAQNSSSVNMACGHATVSSASYTGAVVPMLDMPNSKLLLVSTALASVDSNAAMTITISGSYTAYPTL